jgi:MarR family transcriptional regulator, 2-MHQ and catechol-resistance regulon repressor
MQGSSSIGGSSPGGPQGPAPDEVASLQLILSIGRAFKFVDDYVRPRMQKHGLTMTEFSVLMVLWHGGPIPLGELSERILLTGASTTYTVKKLEKRGLIARESRSEDKRVVMGVITEKGRTLAKKIAPLHATELAEAMHRLSTVEKKTAAQLLRKLRGRGPNEH